MTIEILKNFINETFGIELNNELIKIILHLENKNVQLKTYAVIGDKLVDFLDSLNKKEMSSQDIDDFRQQYSSDEYWERCFDFWKFKNELIWNKSNEIGRKIKTTFIEALCSCFFLETRDLDQTYELIQKIRKIK